MAKLRQRCVLTQFEGNGRLLIAQFESLAVAPLMCRDGMGCLVTSPVPEDGGTSPVPEGGGTSLVNEESRDSSPGMSP